MAKITFLGAAGTVTGSTRSRWPGPRSSSPAVNWMLDATVLAALASPKRLQILDWLRDPTAHFPPQRDGDLVEDGVCVVFIANKLGVAQPTATAHLQALARAGLVTAKRIGQWTFYKRNEAGLRALKQKVAEEL